MSPSLVELKVLAEAEFDIPAAKNLAAGLEVDKRFGPSSHHLMDEQSLLLASVALHLRQMVTSHFDGGRLGLYCAIEVSQHDQEVANILGAGESSLRPLFEREISPSRSLRQMPVSMAFWPAMAVHAEGPVRIFNQSQFAEAFVQQQAQLDLMDGTCEFALILSFDSSQSQIRGKICSRH